ncbi:MAG: OmpA family protein [Bdellovibrionales bacterium]|nr:OmpA family protein [Bdellovibrionales bacterium]
MRRRHEEHENHERWLVSYADFITLLFAFFVVMYATSTNNVDKQKEFENSVRVNLRLSTGGAGKEGGSQVPDAGEIIAEHLQGTEGPQSFPKQGKSAEAADYTARYLSKQINAETQKALGLQVRHDAVGVRVSLAASAMFPEGEFKMKRSALETLNKLGELLKQTDKKIIIEGHTDDQPAESDKFASNWELGSLRATSVVRYLIKYQNIDPKRMAAISYADQKPLVPNDTPEHRAENRRIEVLIVIDEPK